MSRIQRGFASEFILSAQTKRLCCYNRCPLNCWLDKLISSEFLFPHSAIYIFHVDQMVFLQNRGEQLQLRPHWHLWVRTDWASPRRRKVDLAACPLWCGCLPGSGLLRCPVKCSAAVSVPQEKRCDVVIIGRSSLSKLIGSPCEVKQVLC